MEIHIRKKQIRAIYGLSIGYLWAFYGLYAMLFMGYQWSIYGLFMVHLWSIYGRPVVDLWLVYSIIISVSGSSYD